jgi:hypothetical protein
VKKCPFFRWIDAYKKVAAKKIKEDMEKKLKGEMQAAVAYYFMEQVVVASFFLF